MHRLSEDKRKSWKAGKDSVAIERGRFFEDGGDFAE